MIKFLSMEKNQNSHLSLQHRDLKFWYVCWEMAKSTAKLFLLSSFSPSFRFRDRSLSLTCTHNITTRASKSNKKKEKEKAIAKVVTAAAKKSVAVKEKRRTRSNKELDLDEHAIQRYAAHFPVLLGEVVDVFSSKSLRSFVDCTVGAAGHSSAVSHFLLSYNLI